MADDTSVTDLQAAVAGLRVAFTDKRVTEFLTVTNDDYGEVTEFLAAQRVAGKRVVGIVQFRQELDLDDGPLEDGDDEPLEEAVLLLDDAGAMILRDALIARFPQPSPSRDEQLRSMPYQEYLKTPEWNIRRRGALHAAGSRCQLCNRQDKKLHVHDRTYERRGLEHPADLTVLCRRCHARFHDVIEVPAS